VNGRRGIRRDVVALTCLSVALCYTCNTRAAAPAPVAAMQEPEGVVLNTVTGSFGIHRIPKRSMDEVMKSLLTWKHQVLADDSTADFSAEDGILSMECSACGLTRPSAIDLSAIDLDSLVAYEAGAWHIGIRSKDGSQDFFGVLRGEVGPEPHDAALTADDRRIALTALADLYDLAYLTQNPVAQSPAATNVTAKAGKHPPAAADATTAGKPSVTLATLATNGDVEAIRAQQHAKGNSRDVAQALETAYGTRARMQMLKGEVDDALQTLNAGRQSFGKSAALREREAHYVVVGDAYDRLRLAVRLDIGEMQGFLQQIQTSEPEDAAGIQQMFARTLANRIADQRAAGRTLIADGLVSSGRELFPAWAEQLTQGTPGVLPQVGVEVGAGAVPAVKTSSK
jgi:hypothetical protein